MKRKYICHIVFLLLTMTATVHLQAQQANTTKKSSTSPDPSRDVKQFWFVMLTRGSNRNQDSITTARMQKAHLDNIDRLVAMGKIKVAGPFGDNGTWRGIFIFDCETKEEVEQHLASDPAIAAGRLAYEIHPWWTTPTGSFKPGLPEKPKP